MKMNKPNYYWETVIWRRNRILEYLSEEIKQIIDNMPSFHYNFNIPNIRKDLERLIRLILRLIFIVEFQDNCMAELRNKTFQLT